MSRLRLMILALILVSLASPAHAGCGIFSRLGQRLFGQRQSSVESFSRQTTYSGYTAYAVTSCAGGSCSVPTLAPVPTTYVLPTQTLMAEPRYTATFHPGTHQADLPTAQAPTKVCPAPQAPSKAPDVPTPTGDFGDKTNR